MDEEENKRLGELIAELAQGNTNALQGIALSMEKILYVIGASYFRNWADVEDSVHNLYLLLHKKANRFQGNCNAKAWIIRVYENLLRTAKDNLKREEYRLNEFVNEHAHATAMDEKHIENYVFLRQTFCRLTPLEQKLVVYYHWCGCTLREMTKIVRKSKTTVEYYLQKLKEKVEQMPLK